eukprot:s3538_g5.t1
MSRLSEEYCFQLLASLPTAERNRFLAKVSANPLFRGLHNWQRSSSQGADSLRRLPVKASASTDEPPPAGDGFQDTVATAEYESPPAAKAIDPGGGCPFGSKAKGPSPGVAVKQPPPRPATSVG